jgi:inner membrane protein
MEPITHMLTGAVLARSGFNRKATYMTAAMVIAAELPDIDTAWGLLGSMYGFGHHRGITHTFLGIAVEAALVTWGCRAVYRWRHKGGDAAPSWAWLYCGSLVALLSHLLLDWTNNYGLRPFFPFDARWFAGSFVFIFEPVLFGILLVALVAPSLFGLIGSEVGAKKVRFRGRGWAIAALVGVAALYAVRYVEHGKAIEIATQNEPAGTTSVFASPHPVNPFLWSTVTDTPASYRLGTVDTRLGTMLPSMPADTVYKEEVKLAILVAKRSDLGQYYLDWSMYPMITEVPRVVDVNHPWTDVRFEDARFMYDAFGAGTRTKPAMSATVTLDMAASEGQRVVEMRMGENEQK